VRNFFSALLGLFLLSVPASGKELVGIAAVVNDSAISVLDLIARTRMVVLSSGLDDTPELRAQLAKPVLENLIDEKLQTQEAERRGISVSNRELAAALTMVERQNGIREGQLNSWLADVGLPAIFFEDQIRAQVLWAKVVSTSLRPQVDVTQEEVEHELARLEENRGLPEYLVSQIDFYAGPSKSLDDLMEVASKLLVQINAGANFESIAEQFSDNALGSFGGDMGWVTPAQILPE
jgi:Parvulin-like peptidyl-prolyl isomerase